VDIARALLSSPDKAKQLLVDDVGGQVDTFVADIHGRPRHQFADLMLVLTAERAIEEVALLGRFLHASAWLGCIDLGRQDIPVLVTERFRDQF
jgi:hypothetical protein